MDEQAGPSAKRFKHDKTSIKTIHITKLRIDDDLRSYKKVLGTQTTVSI